MCYLSGTGATFIAAHAKPSRTDTPPAFDRRKESWGHAESLRTGGGGRGGEGATSNARLTHVLLPDAQGGGVPHRHVSAHNSYFTHKQNNTGKGEQVPPTAKNRAYPAPKKKKKVLNIQPKNKKPRLGWVPLI